MDSARNDGLLYGKSAIRGGEQAYREQAPQCETYAADTKRPLSIRQRIAQSLRAADVSAQRANAAARASELLDKYPGLDELLDLLTQF